MTSGPSVVLHVTPSHGWARSHGPAACSQFVAGHTPLPKKPAYSAKRPSIGAAKDDGAPPTLSRRTNVEMRAVMARVS